VNSLLLDTHVWIWLANGGPERLDPRVLDAIGRASDRSALALSAISVWEFAMLEAKGRIRVEMDCLDWVTEATRRLGLQVVPLSTAISVASTRLPGDLRGDPADRIIVASARHLGAVVVTRDRALLGYAAAGHVRALEA
jgi:PIN domain nuclease of toxin-antitoxin system